MFRHWFRQLTGMLFANSRARRHPLASIRPARKKYDLLLELLEDRLVPASPINTWLGTDAYPTFNQGLIGQYWQGANGGSGATGKLTETQTGMILKSSGAASWIGSPTYAPAGVNAQGPIPMIGVLSFTNIAANGFIDSLGNDYVDKGTFIGNPSDSNFADNVAARWYGYIYVPSNGITNANGTNPIAFRVGSDDGSALYIDGGTSGASGANFTTPGSGINPQINNAAYQGVTAKSVTLDLTPGLHAIDVEYFNGGGGASFYFNWDPLGGNVWANVPNSNYSTLASSVPPAGGNPADPVGGFSNNWSDPHNWSLGRAPKNGDTVVFDTNATGFNPNNFAGTGSQLLSSDFVSLLGASGNLTLAYNGAQAHSDLVTFNPATGLASLTYNSTASTADVATFTRILGATAFTYNGAASASDVLRLTQAQGTTAITYNGAASADDLVSFTQTSGTATFSYSGASAPSSFPYTASTTAGQLQSYLATITGLSAGGAVLVSGNAGGPFNVHFTGVAGGSNLAVGSGPATVTQAFFYSTTTTVAQMQTYLASIPGLSAANAVVLNGNMGGPFNVNFGTGVTGGTQLVAAGQASVLQYFYNTPNTTAANLQSYLASFPGLTAAGAVSVNGPTGGPFNIAFGPGVTGGAQLVAVSGGNTVMSTGVFSNSATTTAANFQAYLADIPALSAAGAANVDAYTGTAGGPYTVSYGPGISGDPLLKVVGATGATIAAAPALPFTATTTPAQFAAYLATLPGLTGAGAVTVTGTTGGPFYIAYGAGVQGDPLLTVVNNGPATITQQVAAGTPGASQWNPINDEVGLTLNGIVINNLGTLPAPWYLSGNTVTITNTDTTLTNGITNNTVAYPGSPGLVPPGDSPITTVIALGQNSVAGGSIVLGSDTTVTDNGPGPANVGDSQSSLLITSNINLLGNSLISGPSVASNNSEVPDTGLTVILGTIASNAGTTNAVVEAGYGVLELEANNTYIGKTSVTSGLLVDAATDGLGSTTSAAKTVNNTNLFPITGFASSGAALGFAFGGDTAAYTTGVFINGTGLNAPTTFAGALVSADGNANTFAAPITLTGNATLAANAGSLTLTGPIAVGSNALTLSDNTNLILNGAINSTGAASLAKYGTGTATLGHDNSAFGTGGANGSTTGLVAGGGILINNGTLAVAANQALGAVTDTLTFTGSGQYTLGYNGSSGGSFAYSATVTAAQLQAYLVSIPVLSTLPAANVVGNAGGPFTIYGAVISVLSGNATSTVNSNQNTVTVEGSASLGFNGVNYLAQQPVNVFGSGVINGANTDGAIVGVGGTAYFGGPLLSNGTDIYLGSTAGTLTLGNNGAPINLTANNLYLVGTGGLVVLNVPITGNAAGSVGAAGSFSDNVIMNGTDTARLTQSSPTFLGTTTIESGLLEAGADKAFGDGAHSAVVALAGGAVGLFSATSLNYATNQPVSLLGSGVGNGALENVAGNNTFNGVLTFTGTTAIGSDAGNLLLSQNMIQNNSLSFIGAGNTVVTGVISSAGLPVTPGLIESQSSTVSDFTSSIGNISGTDQILWPVMGTTTASVPGTYGYYPIGQHIWSNSDTWIYQGLINVPNLTNDVVNYSSSNPGSITLAYNGQANGSFSYDPTPGTGTTAAAFLAYIQNLPGIPTANNQNGNTSGNVNVTGNAGGPFTVVFPTGTAAANLLTVSSGPAKIVTTPTGSGYLSFAKAIDDGAQIMVDGNVVLRSTAYNFSLGSGELTLSAGLHAIDIRVSNGGGGAGADGSNTNGWSGFLAGPTPFNTVPNGINNLYGEGIVYRVDQGPNDPAGIFVGNRTNGGAAEIPVGTPGIGTSSSGGPGTGDASLDYTVPVDPGDGSLFGVPVTLTKSGTGTLQFLSALPETYKGATAVLKGTLLLDAALTNSAVTVASGAILGGAGPFSQPIAANGAVATGDNGLTAVGTLTANGATTFSATGAYDAVLTGNTGNSTSANSNLIVSSAGKLSLGGATLTVITSATYVPHPVDTYTIITDNGTYDGTMFATFTNNGITQAIVNNSFTLTNAVTHVQTKYTLAYAQGGTGHNNVTLTVTQTSGVATHLQITTSASTIAAGSPITVTVSALDANNLIAANYTGTIHWTSTDAAALSAGLLPPTYTFTNGSSAGTDNGIHTFTNVDFLTASANPSQQTLSATDQNGAAGTSPVVTVTALTQTAHFSVVPTSFTAAPSVAQTFTVTATDIFGNTTTAYAGTIQLSSTDTAATFQGTGIVTNGGSYFYTFTGADKGVHTFTNGVTFNTLGSQTITAHDSLNLGEAGTSAAVNLITAPQKIVLTPLSFTAVAGTALSITAQAQSNGNLAAGYNGTATLSVSGGGATFPASVTLVNGTAAFNVTFNTVAGGPFTITANDAVNLISGTSGPITVVPSAATVFTVAVAPGVQTTGAPLNVTVTALDLHNNVATGYTGTVKLTSTDPNALSLVSGYTFTTGAGNDNGIHTFSVMLKTGGTQFITATDVNSPNPVIAGTSAAVTTRGLIVNTFTPTPTGFTATFSKAFVPANVFLYNGNNTTAADVTMVGSAASDGNHFTINRVNGTLLIDPTNTIITFKATAGSLEQKNTLVFPSDPNYTSVVLPDATYTITLVSGSGNNGFLDALGVGLDGNNNGGHANFVTTFTTHFQANATPVLGIPDFARGPDSSSGGNLVNGHVSTIEVPNQQTSGIPITLYNTPNVTDVTFTLTYNPSLLAQIGAFGGNGSDATDQNSKLVLVSNVAGVATFHYTDATAMSATPDSPLLLGDLTAIVPSTNNAAPLSLYKAKEQLQLANIVINGSANTAVVSSSGIHVNAYFCDLNGDGVIDGLDLLAANNVATGGATGYGAYSQLDPVIVGDAANDLTTDAGDVSTINAYIAQLVPLQIPLPPTQLPPSNSNFVSPSSLHSPNAADPALSLAAGTSASGALGVPTSFDVSVQLDHPHPAGSTGLTEAILALTYDPALLSVAPDDITLGSIPSAGSGWQLAVVVDQASGQIGIELYSLTPITATQAGSLVNIDFHPLPSTGERRGVSPPWTAISPTWIQLASASTPNGQVFSTEVADSQGAMILSPGPDRLATREVDNASAVPLSALIITTPADNNGGSAHAAPSGREDDTTQKPTADTLLRDANIETVSGFSFGQQSPNEPQSVRIGIAPVLNALLYRNSPGALAGDFLFTYRTQAAEFYKNDSPYMDLQIMQLAKYSPPDEGGTDGLSHDFNALTANGVQATSYPQGPGDRLDSPEPATDWDEFDDFSGY